MQLLQSITTPIVQAPITRSFETSLLSSGTLCPLYSKSILLLSQLNKENGTLETSEQTIPTQEETAMFRKIRLQLG